MSITSATCFNLVANETKVWGCPISAIRTYKIAAVPLECPNDFVQQIIKIVCNYSKTENTTWYFYTLCRKKEWLVGNITQTHDAQDYTNCVYLHLAPSSQDPHICELHYTQSHPGAPAPGCNNEWHVQQSGQQMTLAFRTVIHSIILSSQALLDLSHENKSVNIWLTKLTDYVWIRVQYCNGLHDHQLYTDTVLWFRTENAASIREQARWRKNGLEHFAGYRSNQY